MKEGNDKQLVKFSIEVDPKGVQIEKFKQVPTVPAFHTTGCRHAALAAKMRRWLQ